MKKDILVFIAITLIVSAFVFLNHSGVHHRLNPAQYEGTASWYSRHDPGVLKTTANMELFNDNDFTCAMWDVPFGTKLKITNLENGRSVVVRVNDRGPAKRLVRRGRIVDLSKKAFSKIAPLRKGLVTVEVSVLSYL